MDQDSLALRRMMMDYRPRVLAPPRHGSRRGTTTRDRVLRMAGVDIPTGEQVSGQ